MAAFSETAEHHCEAVCDETHGGPNSNWYHCKNQRKHKNFLTVDEFGMEHLPPELRTEVVMDSIKNQIDRTVKISVSYTSNYRPDTFPNSPAPYPFHKYKGSYKSPRCGTGFINKVYGAYMRRDPCPCPECKESNHPKMNYWRVRVSTATHVVFDSTEAKSALVELFYDKENKDGVRYLYGSYIRGPGMSNYQRDRCEMLCVTHEKDLAESLGSLCKCSRPASLIGFLFKCKFGILVSHPHGVSKRISIGQFLNESMYVKRGCRFTIAKGARFFIPLGDDKQEDTQQCDHRGDHNGPPPKKIEFSSQSIKEDENSKTREAVKPPESFTLTSLPDFSTIFNLTEGKNVFKSKVTLKAYPPPRSLVRRGELTSPQWHTFPADTRYVLPDGTNSNVPVSTEIQFDLSKSVVWGGGKRESFLIYDMAACPGSSGALVCCSDGCLVSEWLHFGCNGGKGQSGLSRFLSTNDLMSLIYNDDEDEEKIIADLKHLGI